MKNPFAFAAALTPAALQKVMADSPEAAIDVCATRAPALAAEHSKPGVTVGRSAPKLRSEANDRREARRAVSAPPACPAEGRA